MYFPSANNCSTLICFMNCTRYCLCPTKTYMRVSSLVLCKIGCGQFWKLLLFLMHISSNSRNLLLGYNNLSYGRSIHNRLETVCCDWLRNLPLMPIELRNKTVHDRILYDKMTTFSSQLIRIWPWISVYCIIYYLLLQMLSDCLPSNRLSHSLFLVYNRKSFPLVELQEP